MTRKMCRVDGRPFAVNGHCEDSSRGEIYSLLFDVHGHELGHEKGICSAWS